MRLVLRMQVGGDMFVRVRTLIRWDEAFWGLGRMGIGSTQMLRLYK
jgi:hypothetical protein